MIKGQAKQSRQLHNPKFTLSTANFKTLRVFPLQVLASSLLPQQILNFPSNLFTHFDKPKNSLELPYPTRNIRKCSNKLMTNTSGEINLQSKQDIICHVEKVKPATSAHYVVDVIPFLPYFKNTIKFNRFSLRVRSSQRSHASHIIQELRFPRLFFSTVVISLPMT